MCVICDNIDRYNEEYPLGLSIELEVNDPLDTILIYFSSVDHIQTLCLEQIKKKAYKNLSRDGGTVCDMETSRAWFKAQCFYDIWVQFKDKIRSEKKKLNEELRYSF